MFDQVVEHVQELDVWLFALVFTSISERQVHQESSCVLNAVVSQLISLISQDRGYPFDQVQLYHDSLWLPPK